LPSPFVTNERIWRNINPSSGANPRNVEDIDEFRVIGGLIISASEQVAGKTLVELQGRG
jgi:hypothetical protein